VVDLSRGEPRLRYADPTPGDRPLRAALPKKCPGRPPIHVLPGAGTNLSGRRWCVALVKGAPWLVLSVAGQGPRGVRLVAREGRPLVFFVGGFEVFIADGAEAVFAVRDEGEAGQDPDVAAEWDAAGNPPWSPT
jgi:hypothetical protein